MKDIKIKYMGLELANPIIAGASHMTGDLDKIKKLEEAGAGAIVCKSLFQEQIQLEQMIFEDSYEEMQGRHPEMARIFTTEFHHAGAKEHKMWVEEAKKRVAIPVIASLNALDKETWLEYSRHLQDSGADALELNFFHVPSCDNIAPQDIEKYQLDVLASVKQAVSIPVAVKLSCFYTNPIKFIQMMDSKSADAFIIFNRLFENSIDIEKQQHTTRINLSRPGDNELPLRYIGILFNKVKASLCANTGILTGQDCIRAILTGADAVYIVSTLYKNGLKQIQSILNELKQWMDKNDYQSLVDFRGKLSQEQTKDPFVYQRAQYAKLLINSQEVMTYHITER